MSNQITANGFSPSTLADLPAIRTFQMDSDSHSQIANSVNLFRGDINLPLELIVHPGFVELMSVLTPTICVMLGQSERT